MPTHAVLEARIDQLLEEGPRSQLQMDTGVRSCVVHEEQDTLHELAMRVWSSGDPFSFVCFQEQESREAT